MLGHLSYAIGDLETGKAFYDAVMEALGYARVHTSDSSIGYGLKGTAGDKLLLFLSSEPVRPPSRGFHLAFTAPDRASVDAFHAAALAHGGTDNGAPGLRAHYGPNYYAAFVIDPDGYRLEAVHK